MQLIHTFTYSQGSNSFNDVTCGHATIASFTSLFVTFHCFEYS